MKKKIAIAALAVATMMTLSMSLFADSTGWRQNNTGWWYATNEAGTTWHANGWQWLDGNKDGIAECYYFDTSGYCLTNTTTPDGYTVNADGAWVVNGVVQTKQISIVGGGSQSADTSASSGSGSVASSNSKSDTGIKFSDYNWKFTPSSTSIKIHGNTTVSSYLGVYALTSKSWGTVGNAPTDGTYQGEFAILSDGSLSNTWYYDASYCKGDSRVSDTKWSNTSGNLTSNWEILDNGKTIRHYSTIAGKFNDEVIYTKVSD